MYLVKYLAPQERAPKIGPWSSRHDACLKSDYLCRPTAAHNVVCGSWSDPGGQPRALRLKSQDDTAVRMAQETWELFWRGRHSNHRNAMALVVTWHVIAVQSRPSLPRPHVSTSPRLHVSMSPRLTAPRTGGAGTGWTGQNTQTKTWVPFDRTFELNSSIPFQYLSQALY